MNPVQIKIRDGRVVFMEGSGRVEDVEQLNLRKNFSNFNKTVESDVYQDLRAFPHTIATIAVRFVPRSIRHLGYERSQWLIDLARYWIISVKKWQLKNLWECQMCHLKHYTANYEILVDAVCPDCHRSLRFQKMVIIENEGSECPKNQ